MTSPSTPYTTKTLTVRSAEVPSYAKHTISSARGAERRFQYTHQKPEPVTPTKQQSPRPPEEKQLSFDSPQVAHDHNHERPHAHTETPPQRKCICGICNCGRHRCPARVHMKSYDKDVLNSSYRKSFTPHETPKRQFYAPTYSVNFGGWEPDQFSTVSRNTYRPYDSKTLYDIHKHKTNTNTIQPAPPTPFTATTEYDQQYTPKRVERVRPSTAPNNRTSEYDLHREFSASTTNRDDYKPWETPKRVFSPRTPHSYSPSRYDPADLNSTYAANFKSPPEGYRVSRQLAPASSPNPNDVDSSRFLTTTHREEFTPKPLNLCPSVFLQTKEAESSGHVFYELHDGKWV